MKTLKLKDYLIIQITGTISTFIAEVIQEEPLIVKVTETGPYSRLKQAGGDFIIMRSDTEQFHADIENDTNIFLESHDEDDKRPLSGLKSLGVHDDTLRYMFPGK